MVARELNSRDQVPLVNGSLPQLYGYFGGPSAPFSCLKSRFCVYESNQ